MSVALFFKALLSLLLAAPPSFSTRLKMESLLQSSVDLPPAALTQPNQDDPSDASAKVSKGDAEDPKVVEKNAGGLWDRSRDAFEGAKQRLQKKMQSLDAGKPSTNGGAEGSKAGTEDVKVGGKSNVESFWDGFEVVKKEGLFLGNFLLGGAEWLQKKMQSLQRRLQSKPEDKVAEEQVLDRGPVGK